MNYMGEYYMAVTIRRYNDIKGYSDDFYKVCDFLIRINEKKAATPNYLWARWVWQFGPYMSMAHLSHIGIAQDGDKIVGLATYEGDVGEAYFCVDDEYNFLKWDLIEYAIKNLSANGKIRITLPDGDLSYQQAAIQKGFIAGKKKSEVARIDVDSFRNILPDGYRVMSFDNDEFENTCCCGKW